MSRNLKTELTRARWEVEDLKPAFEQAYRGGEVPVDLFEAYSVARMKVASLEELLNLRKAQ